MKSSICLTLFYICFKALFSNDTFFRFNRWTLLTGIVICHLLPGIPFQTTQFSVIRQQTTHLERLVVEIPARKETESVSDKIEMAFPAQQPMEIPWRELIFLFYFSGCIVCAGGTALAFYKMYRIIRSGKRVRQENYTLVLTSESSALFSWEHYIILSEEDYRHNPDEILTHERMHLRYRHSRDLLFMEIILLLHWFNPAIWLLKKELRDIHEYQADKGVLNQGIDATKYQLLLVKKAVSSSLYTLANSFNHSKIKKRITMMLKEKSNKWARLKLLLLMPVGFTAMCVFARPETKINSLEDRPPTVQHKGTNSPKKTKENGETIITYRKKSTAKKIGGKTVYYVSMARDSTPQDKKNCTVLFTIPSADATHGYATPNIKRVVETFHTEKYKTPPKVQILPMKADIPQEYLEGLKKDLEVSGLIGEIQPYELVRKELEKIEKRTSSVGKPSKAPRLKSRIKPVITRDTCTSYAPKSSKAPHLKSRISYKMSSELKDK